MKTFTATLNIKIGAFVLFILTLIATGAMINVAIGLNSSITDIRETFSDAFGKDTTASPLDVISLALCSLPILFFGALTVLALAYFVSILKARLIFDNHSMTFEFNPRLPSYRNRGLKPFSIQYNQIQRIKGLGETGSLEIYDLQGKVSRLAPVMFGKNYGENVLDELKRRLPTELHSSISDHIIVQKDWLKKQRAASIPMLICLVAYFATMFFDYRFSSRPWIDAWQIEFKPPSMFEPVWGYAPDPQGNFWVIGWGTDHYRIYRHPDELNRDWKLPDSILGGEYPKVASQDAAGNPIVWSPKKVFHFTNGSWKAFPYQDNLEYIDWERSGVVSERYGWAVETQGKRFIKIDGLTGEWSAIPLPESSAQLNISPHSMRQALNGGFLILARNDTTDRVYLFKNEKWQPQEYSIILPDGGTLWDYFLDNNGLLWALISVSDSSIVEKISPSGELQLTTLSWSTDIDGWPGYKRIFIDTYERMWVAGSYPPYITVFQPTWKGNAVELVRYTIGNSNYQEGSSDGPTMMPDGKIWGFDQRITTMDTNQKDLPAPLPDWFGNLDWNLIRLAITPFQLIAVIYMTIKSKKLQKQLKLRS